MNPADVAGEAPAFTVLIPARLASTRLPNKPLADIAGIPMVVRVAQRARQSGDWDGPAMERENLMQLLQQRIQTLDIAQAQADVRPFLRDARALDIWSPRYFRDLADRVVCP